MLGSPLEKLVVSVAMIVFVVLVASGLLFPGGGGGDYMGPGDVADLVSSRLLFASRNTSVTVPGVVVRDLVIGTRSYEGGVLDLYSPTGYEHVVRDNITLYTAVFSIRALWIKGGYEGAPEEPGGLFSIVMDNSTNVTYTEVISGGGEILVVPHVIVYFSNSSGAGNNTVIVNIYVAGFDDIYVNNHPVEERSLSGKYNFLITQSLSPVTVVPVERVWMNDRAPLYIRARLGDWEQTVFLGYLHLGDRVVVNIYRVSIDLSLEMVSM